MRKRVEGEKLMITYKDNKQVDINRLIHLFEQAGWGDKTSDISRLNAMIDNSQIVITAWDGDLMVGFARCTTDYVFNGQINNVVVDEKYQGQGIGKGLVSRIINSSKLVTYMLRGDAHNEDFYRSMGFKIADRSMLFNRVE